MTDFFAELQEPRRARIDLEPLKARFLERAAQVHPDRFHHSSESEKLAAQQAYTTLNTAFETLRDPRKRLQHWLELESGQTEGAVQSVPSHVMEYAMQAGQILREVDRHLAAQTAATSPVLKAGLFAQSVEWQDMLTKFLGLFDQSITMTNLACSDFDERWQTPLPAEAWPRLAELAHTHGYLGKWRAQLQDRQVKLAL